MRTFTIALLCWLPVHAAAQSEQAEDDDHRLEWTFPEMHPVEYFVGFGGQLALPIVRDITDTPNRVRWTGSNFLDDGVQEAIGDSSAPTRLVVEVLSDVTWYSNTAWPFIDALVVAWLLDGNPHVAWQMFAIAVSATALDGFVTLALMHLVGRHRPRTRYCLERGGSAEECDVDNAKSFPSGHTAGSFTGAGLTCAAHGALPLYGGGAHDTAACISALTLAAGTGLFRIMGDKHYVLDVVAGAGIGLTFGWFLPWLLHYRYDASEDASEESEGSGAQQRGLMLVPFGDERGALGLAAAGWF